MSNKQALSDRGFLLACLAGLGFGGFFVLIAQVERGFIFTPLILARIVQLAVALLAIRTTRLPFPSFRANPIALLAGALDVGGNIFYVLAQQFVRLDVAAVLASFYPASTVVLSSVLFEGESVTQPGIGPGSLPAGHCLDHSMTQAGLSSPTTGHLTSPQSPHPADVRQPQMAYHRINSR